MKKKAWLMAMAAGVLAVGAAELRPPSVPLVADRKSVV